MIERRPNLRQLLPNRKIVKDLRTILAEGGWQYELGGRMRQVPQSARMDVVARSFHSYEYEIGFGNHFRVLVAIGGVRRVKHGIPYSRLGFATLWYSEKRGLVTTDFHGEMPGLRSSPRVRKKKQEHACEK